MHEYGVTLTKFENVRDADCFIIAVAHDIFRKMKLDELKAKFNSDLAEDEKVLIDVKGLYPVQDLKDSGISYWRL